MKRKSSEEAPKDADLLANSDIEEVEDEDVDDATKTALSPSTTFRAF